MKTLSEIDVFGKRVFLRADLDVPITNSNFQTPNSNIDSLTSAAEIATRLTNLKPTVDYLLGHGASQIVIAGHIDRPSPRLRNGKPVIDPALSTKQLLPVLEKILGRQILFVPDLFSHSRPGRESLGTESSGRTSDSHFRENDSGVILLENLRFWTGEIANDPTFAKQLAYLADVYVNEAFGNCHRLHASMVTLPTLLPHAAGFHLEQEVEELTKILKGPQKPFVAIVGGTKIETKLPLVEHLAKIADYVLVGGELPHEIRAKKMKFTQNVLVATLTTDGKDIDVSSMNRFIRMIKAARTVVWNGPLGLFEEGHDKGSIAIARAVIDSPTYEVVGGGETVEFLVKNNLLSHFSFVSAGGGAMLGFLSGKTLPAIEALK